jgi:hypothetical protein
MQELISFAPKVVFKVMLGKRQEAIGDLHGYADIGWREEAVTLARRLRLPTAGLMRK